ncbi:hypothetical protein JCM17845_09000 [Iodidimonas gelatinilytica]|uniref:Peptidase M28 domain-containing protein n=1 Tax=Iodidimonas gelatinilytica TaxID=1236966 RepID=A0A5A7MWR4_9PROT|nr:M28 family metallopeptidase [Iodidimonas gelatinilytica]GER00277.1 hypothetical protein JCM17845_09000 [Iodidimonas gelatinilytica]
MFPSRSIAPSLFSAACLLLLAGCDNADSNHQNAQQSQASSAASGFDRATTEQLLHQHIKILASDAFEGRAPASAGEEKTVAYLIEQFKALGLKPGFGDSYTQSVPLIELTAKPEDGQFQAFFTKDDEKTGLDYGSQIVAWTKQERERVEVSDSDIVFVGYGITAPEYGWDDYEAVDVTGKTVLILVNDPGFETENPDLFTGKAMTYYGRWTYKYEEAARHGAAAAILVHQSEPAGYPWAVVQSSWTGPQFSLVSPDGGSGFAAVEAWISEQTAQTLFAQAGMTLENAKAAALSPEFKAQSLPLTFSATLNNSLRHTQSNNVMAVLEGSAAPDEAMLYMAHWDHIGMDPALTDDPIYNGALDNATGTAGLLALAKAFSALDESPRRSVAFLATTAEEQGLLGSAYYAQNPAIPAHKTVAAINMDGANIHGPMKDITIIGEGQNDLQDLLTSAAKQQNRTLSSEPTPEHGYFYRSDHFNLAKIGIPVLYTDSGTDSRAHGRDWTLEQNSAYIDRAYHKPADEYDPDWDLSGAAEDLELFYTIGLDLASSNDWPGWKDGSEFRAARMETGPQPKDSMK